ncbi:WD40 repeat-containing protein SMU1-like protein [Spinellus fusiger]|nr:WD40 repeat-containing protein SMU1-like protein [Spinellus fusiger]
MSIEIESEDVIRLILQFLKENKFDKAFTTLEEETTITLNTMDSKEAFVQDVTQGHWDTVLKQVAKLKIPPRKLLDLYEQVVIELVEMKEISAARTLLRQTEPMQILKNHHPERYLHLEHVLSRTVFDSKDAYPHGTTKEKRRHIIAQALTSQVAVVPPERLKTLLHQCMKWQQNQGLLSCDNEFDVFGDSKSAQPPQQDEFVSEHYATIKYPSKGTYAECIAFSPNGQCLVTGSVDGFIELWNHSNGTLRKDLKYQAEDQLMAMDESVISLCFSRDSELLASGSTDGKIAIWKIQSGYCQRRFSPAHSQGVTCVAFSKDASQLLSGSYDQTLKIHSTRSGKSLKKFIGHSKFVNSALYSSDGMRVLSGSSDGTVKIWDIDTEACIHTLPYESTESPSVAVQSLTLSPKTAGQLLVCTKSNTLSLVQEKGAFIRAFSHNIETGSEFVASAFSPLGELAYGLSEKGVLYCFNVATGVLVGSRPITDTEVIGLAGHPFTNSIACNDDSGNVYLIKA